jgi:hypothetical protein
MRFLIRSAIACAPVAVGALAASGHRFSTDWLDEQGSVRGDARTRLATEVSSTGALGGSVHAVQASRVSNWSHDPPWQNRFMQHGSGLVSA